MWGEILLNSVLKGEAGFAGLCTAVGIDRYLSILKISRYNLIFHTISIDIYKNSQNI
jgi:hypothetical protein